jgi:nitrate reductase alpha subunit
MVVIKVDKKEVTWHDLAIQGRLDLVMAVHFFWVVTWVQST